LNALFCSLLFSLLFSSSSGERERECATTNIIITDILKSLSDSLQHKTQKVKKIFQILFTKLIKERKKAFLLKKGSLARAHAHTLSLEQREKREERLERDSSRALLVIFLFLSQSVSERKKWNLLPPSSRRSFFCSLSSFRFSPPPPPPPFCSSRRRRRRRMVVVVFAVAAARRRRL